MKLRTFASVSLLEREALALLREHMGTPEVAPHAVMLSGGRTPMGLYQHIEQRPFPVDGGLHLLLSDERYVSVESPESNYGRLAGMVAALGVDDGNVMRVRTELPLQAAADRYNDVLTSFVESGGMITLGLLGLGADGHTASLFRAEDVCASRGRYAMAVSRDEASARISVTRDLLLAVGRLVFVVSGKDKKEIVQRLVKRPDSVPAGMAVHGASDVNVWYAP